MYKQTMNVVKSVGMGMVAGAAVAMVSKKVMSGSPSKSGSMKKAAGKAMHSVGELVMDVEKMLK